jgi:nitrogen fixation protein NifU and related proteins
MYDPKLLEHFQHPRNVGVLPPPAIEVRVMNPVCGDILHLTAIVEGGVVTAAAFQAKGCTASMACGSALTELLAGRTVDSLQKFTTVEIEATVGGLPAESKHAASLCVDAVSSLRQALAR